MNSEGASIEHTSVAEPEAISKMEQLPSSREQEMMHADNTIASEFRSGMENLKHQQSGAHQ